MTQLTPTSRRQSMFGARVLLLMAAAVVLFVGLAGTAQAQWTTPNGANNINNTNTGNVGIGTTTPNYKLDVQGGAINAASGLCIASVCKASWSDVGFWSSAIGGTIYYGMGNVGIGPTPPDSPLTVNANSGLQAPGANFPGTVFHLSGADNTNARMLFDAFGGGFTPQLTYRYARGTAAAPSAVLSEDPLGQLTASGYKATSYANGSRASLNFLAAENWNDTSNGTQITFNTTAKGASTPVERLRLLHNGSVGIGTTNPTFDTNGGRYLSVDGGSGFIGSIGAAGGTNSNGTTVGQVAFVNSNLGTTDKRVATIVGATDTATNSGTLDFYTASAGAWGIPKLRISAGGNVGIGTMSPGFRLDVQGGQLNASGGLCIGGDCKTAWSQVGGSQWTTGGSGALYYNGGNVGLGTATPDVNAKLHLAGSGGIGQDIQTTGNEWSRLRFVVPGRTYGFFLDGGSGGFGTGKFGLHDYTAAAWRLVVDTSGNIGMGTTTPGAPLEVRRDQNAQTLLNLNNATAGSATGAGTGIRFYENATLNSHIFVANSGSSGYQGGARTLQFWNYQNSPILFGTNGAERVRFDGAGNVGIGTTSPAVKLDVSGQLHVAGVCGTSVPNSQGGYVSWNQMACGAGEMDFINHQGGGTGGFWFANTATAGATLTSLMFIKGDGNVGIGTNTPTAKLDVVGNLNVTGTGNLNASGTISGGNIVAKYQDVAEWVESSQALPAGTVVVLDHTKSNQVVASSQSYDTRVAGVISAQPGITLGEKGESKVLVATTGRVKIKVDATAGPIQVGDLLVTSDIAGVAKKSQPLNLGGVEIHRPGTLIGKALEPLASGTGEILVLLSLQ